MERTPERKAAERAVIAGYERWLRLYARVRRFPRECGGLWAIESGLVGAFERGVEDKDLALGIAIVLANVGFGGFALAVAADGVRYSEAKVREIMGRVTDREIKDVARWLTRVFRRGRLGLRPKRSRNEYVEKLWELEGCWGQMPITNPLPA